MHRARQRMFPEAARCEITNGTLNCRHSAESRISDDAFNFDAGYCITFRRSCVGSAVELSGNDAAAGFQTSRAAGTNGAPRAAGASSAGANPAAADRAVAKRAAARRAAAE